MKKVIYEESYTNGDKSYYELETTNNKINDTRMEMRYHPDDPNWLCGGDTVLSLIDNGNFITFKFGDTKEIELDYAEATELMMMLKYMNDDSGTVHLPTTIKRVNKVGGSTVVSNVTITGSVSSQPLFDD